MGGLQQSIFKELKNNSQNRMSDERAMQIATGAIADAAKMKGVKEPNIPGSRNRSTNTNNNNNNQ